MTDVRTALATVLARQADDLIDAIEADILFDIIREGDEVAHMDNHIFYEVVVPVLHTGPTSLIMISTFTNDTNYYLREQFRKFVISVLGSDPYDKLITLTDENQ